MGPFAQYSTMFPSDLESESKISHKSLCEPHIGSDLHQRVNRCVPLKWSMYFNSCYVGSSLSGFTVTKPRPVIFKDYQRL